ncbi:hypothetical protein DL95DRAFT_512208 [Leptodontidium sp. 2 PMI_412]|nr:hypothetical protein DL95DRAFT_512208 [Leptodontidium sp. 2 PMI_412]
MEAAKQASAKDSKNDLPNSTTDGRSVGADGSLPAYERFFENDHLLWNFLSNLSQGELLRLQCVCKRWKATTDSSYTLSSQLFRPQGLGSKDESVNSVLEPNTFVSERIRWTPEMDVDQVNSSDFKTVRESKSLRAMAAPGASWRSQLISRPAIFDITVTSGVGVEEGAPLLRIICPRASQPSAPDDTIGTTEPEVSEDEDEEELEEVMKLNVQEFPHNEDKAVKGITFEDVIFALRKQYIEYDTAFEARYEYLDLEAETAGRWIISFDPPDEDSELPNLQLSILLF